MIGQLQPGEVRQSLFRCERALGINKVTGLQRWCPKLEVGRSKTIVKNGINYL